MDELIKALRKCGEEPYDITKPCKVSPWKLMRDAADAIQTLCDELATYHGKSFTDDKKIAELNTKCADLQSQINSMENEIEELLPKKVIPHRNYENLNLYWCDCGWFLRNKDKTPNYCPNCGKRIEWENAE